MNRYYLLTEKAAPVADQTEPQAPQSTQDDSVAVVDDSPAAQLAAAQARYDAWLASQPVA